MLRISIIFCFLLSSFYGFSQGTVRGKISDKNGETLIGATIVLKANPGVGVTTDFDGNYSFKITESSPQTLVVSYISYKTLEFTVNPKNNEVIVRNFTLESSEQNVSEVQITGKAVRSNDVYTETIKMKSATTIDVVSSMTMKKTGDATVTAAVARVAGVSTNGAFITVRGIGDRYVKTGINGSRIPTLDPFTNNIKLDLFPSSLIDNVIINKTANPDIPADWAGAYLSVETKDFPEQLSVNVETSFGYNNQSTFKNIISADRSKTDWLGYDNSLRDRQHTTFTNANSNPSQYEEFVALGLGNYYASIGVNASNWDKNSENYLKLGLVQLGLLAPALFYDSQAVAEAKNLYQTGPYSSEAFKVINANVPATGTSFPNNWNTTTRRAPLNFSQNITVGNQILLFKRPLGFLAGLRYYTANQYDGNATANRASVVGDSTGQLINSVSSQLSQQSSVEVNGWNALVNLAYKLNNENSISFLFMPNVIGTNRVRKSYDRGDKVVTVSLNQFYESRKQLIYQLKTEHYIPKYKTKLESNFSYTRGKSTTPDFKNLQYWINPDSTYQVGGSIGDGIHRYYRYLTDNVFDSRISAEIPISPNPDAIRKIKVGGSYQRSDQVYDQYDYFITTGPDIGPLLNEDIDAFLSPDQFEISSGLGAGNIPYSTINAFYSELGTAANHNFGNSSVGAAYLMADMGVTPKIRLSGGVRMEIANIFTDVVKFDSLGYAKNDPRRVYSDAFPIANPGEMHETDFLPSINFIYKVKEEASTNLNIRLNYSKSVARPSIRELSDIAILDYELRAPVYGNSDLKKVKISNYDFRFEGYFKSGNSLSTSLFYKTFDNHIELINANGYTWQNVDESHVEGIELEGKIKLTKQLSFSSNITLVKSTTTFVRQRYDLVGGIKQYYPLDTVTRTMYGQAPYAINAILSYSLDSLGLNLAIGYNIQGPRLVIASNNKEVPDVYEIPRHLLDFKATKKVGKYFSIGITVKDILNSPVRRSYKYPEGYDVLDYDKYTYGTNYILTISYKIN